MNKQLEKIKREEKWIEEQTEKIAIALAEEDFYSYIALMWKYARTSSDFKPEWYVEAIADHLTALYKGEIKKLAISLSPRHGKSTICNVLFPTWVWIQDPSIQFLTAAYGEALALRDARAARDLISSTLYQKHWGHIFQFKYDQNKKEEYDNDAGGRRLTTSVEGRGTGEGSDILIIDDPHKAKDYKSSKKLGNVLDWYYGTIKSRYNNPAEWRQLVIHQRIAEGDLIGSLIEENTGWVLLDFPEEYELQAVKKVTPIGFSDPREYKGELLAPSIFNEEAAEAAKADPVIWQTQYQQNPSAKGAGLLKESSLLSYLSPINYNELFTSILSIDTAHNGEGVKAYSVFQIWAKSGKKKYLIDQTREFMTFTEEEKEAKRLIDTYRPNYTLIEKKANGAVLIETLKKDNYGEIIGINPQQYGDKVQRFSSVVPEFDAGQVIIPSIELKGWIKEYREELLSFPRSKYKDQVDATSQALLWYRVNDVDLERRYEQGEESMKEDSVWRKEWYRNMLNNKEDTYLDSPREWFN
jgi:predicted phage terminase large subunit-like protein